MASPNVPKPRRRPRQARSQQIVQAIQEACRRLLVTEGPAAVNTNRIAEVAGVNVASVYRYFPNKDAIFAEIYERQLELESRALEGLHARAAEIDALPLRGKLGLLVDVYADHRLRLLRLHGDFYRRHHDAFDLGDRSSERYSHSWQKQSAVWVGSILAQHASELGIGSAQRAGFIVLSALRGVMDAAVKQRPADLEKPAFREDVVRLLDRYLTAK